MSALIGGAPAETPGGGRGEALRRYPPLLAGLLAIVLAMTVLPSALNVPQTNPSQTLEFAPVPPGDETAPQTGNASSLSLGTSGAPPAAGPGGDGPGPTEPPPEALGPDGLPLPDPDGSGNKPSEFRCVGNPPRQTEDPMAPPCVAFFDGDNGGTTYQGVSGDEIKVVFVACGNCVDPNDGTWGPPAGMVCDLDTPPDSGKPECSAHNPGGASNPDRIGATDRSGGSPLPYDNVHVKVLRALNKYFNDRFQMYDRRVHMYVYWPDDHTLAEKRSADAAEVAQLDPFATIDRATLYPGGHRRTYVDGTASRGILNVIPVEALPREDFQRHPGLVWGVYPDAEGWARMYADYVCTRVAGFPVAHAQGGRDPDGQPYNGRARKFGLLRSGDTQFPQYGEMAGQVERDLAKCGVKIDAHATYVPPNPDTDPSGSQAAQDSTSQMAAFQQEGITTVLHMAGQTPLIGRAMSTLNYYPEIVIAGDGIADRGSVAQVEDQSAWRNAWVMTPYQVREDETDATYGFQACGEGNPEMSRANRIPYCNFYYRDLFLLHQMIQVAGPQLSPTSIERGLRAIPPIVSTDPYRPSCFFEPGEYTCIKDAVEEWWDGDGDSPQDSAPGCWRMVNEGRRFQQGKWRRGDQVFDNPNDPCNGAGAFFAR